MGERERRTSERESKVRGKEKAGTKLQRQKCSSDREVQRKVANNEWV